MHGKRSPSRLQNAIARNLRCHCISKSSNARNRGVVRKWSSDTSFSIRKWWVNSCGILQLETSISLSPKSRFLQFPNKVNFALELILVCHGCHGNISLNYLYKTCCWTMEMFGIVSNLPSFGVENELENDIYCHRLDLSWFIAMESVQLLSMLHILQSNKIINCSRAQTLTN